MKTIKNVIMPITFTTEGYNLNTTEPVWLVTMHLGSIKIDDFKYYGKNENSAIEAARNYLKNTLK